MRTRCLAEIGIYSVGIVLAGSASSRFVIAQDGVAVGPWKTGAAITCPSGKIIPRNTPISGPNVTAADLCGSDPAPAARTAAPSSLSEALTPAVQSLGYSLGQQLGKAILGDPAATAANAAAAQQRALAAQERARAAQQLNNSGIYLFKQKNYTGAINEFQQALNIAPDDANILRNLASAKQQLKNTAVAAQTSGALGQFLGNTPANAGNFDSGQLTRSSSANPNASVLSLVNLDSDSNVVDLRGATSASPESLKSQLDGLLTNRAPASAPPDPLVVLPEARDIELLFQPPQSTPSSFPGQQRPANEPKPLNPIDAEEQTKAQVEAIFGKPGGLDDVMLQQIQDDAIAGISKPAPAKTAPVLPHN
jgi:TPR repeat